MPKQQNQSQRSEARFPQAQIAGTQPAGTVAAAIQGCYGSVLQALCFLPGLKASLSWQSQIARRSEIAGSAVVTNMHWVNHLNSDFIPSAQFLCWPTLMARSDKDFPIQGACRRCRLTIQPRKVWVNFSDGIDDYTRSLRATGKFVCHSIIHTRFSGTRERRLRSWITIPMMSSKLNRDQ